MPNCMSIDRGNAAEQLEQADQAVVTFAVD